MNRNTSATISADACGRLGWAAYDWANSPFTTLVITFVIPAYFASVVVGDPVRGQAMWGSAIAAGGLLVALLAPVLGAIADAGGGRRKPWIFGFTLLCCLGSALLWFVEPTPAAAALCLACVLLANIGFEFGIVFNNAMLPDIVSEERIGRLSGWAWGAGYAGGLAALLLVLVLLIWPETPPFGLDKAAAEQVRIVGPIVALWFALFSLPLFLFTPDRRTPAIRGAARAGLKQLRDSIAALPRNRGMARFLLAHMLYADGLATLFAFGGLYAAGVFGMTMAEVIGFGVALNVAAGLGAILFGWVDDRLGSKQTIMLALTGLIAASVVAVLAPNVHWFWGAGIVVGLFVGPAQAASRSLMARLAPEEERGAYFGLFALSGRATAFAGPSLVAAVTSVSGSQRAGLATILLFFTLGLLLLRRAGRQM